jgi:hypothetical protein
MTASIKLRPFIWKRVILDREGIFAKNQVANSSLNGLDPNWKDKKVIWEFINEFEKIPMSLVEAKFPQKMDKPKPVVGDDTIKKVGKKSFFQGEK